MPRRDRHMQPTPYAAVNTLLARLTAGLPAVLGARLVGLYLYGSLVAGDFDPAISDVDLLAVLTEELDDAAFAALDALHARLIAAQPAWTERIEIAYLAARALQTFRTTRSPIAIISPGEPFHRKDAGADWLINWYVVRTQGRALIGPPAATLIPPISADEFRAAVVAQARAWRTYVAATRDSRPYQGYAILTLCRALYAVTHGVQASKRQAGAWVAAQLPEWAPLIAEAFRWRAAALRGPADPAPTYPTTVRFVQALADRVEAAAAR